VICAETTWCEFDVPGRDRSGEPSDGRGVMRTGAAPWCANVARAQRRSAGRRLRPRLAAAAAGLLVVLATLLALTSVAWAATVSGTIKGAAGQSLVLVQANGRGVKAKLPATGAFRISGARLPGASLHLIKADGSYYGPVVLKGGARVAYCTLRGTADLKLGALTLQGGYARAVSPRAGRYDTRDAYVVTAKRSRPIGAGNAGLVRTATTAGYRGAGGDLDRDGVVGAFDIDDNGNRILDNVDRTTRGERRPRAALSAGARSVVVAADPPVPTEFRIFSNYKLGGERRINASIPGISDMDALIAREMPQTVFLAIRVLGGETARLDGLGNEWVAPHAVDGIDYPRIEIAWPDLTPAGFTGGLLELVAGAGRQGDALVSPGATPDEIGPGDAFIEVAQDGTRYPGVLNFVFTTAPALKSWRFDTDGAATEMTYGADGVPTNGSPVTVPTGAKEVTLTFWRPQRRAAPGESGDWIDMGKLDYSADVLGPARVSGAPDAPEQPGGFNQSGFYTAAAANGTPATLLEDGWGVRDPSADAAADADNTMSFTVSLPAVYPEWAGFSPGTFFEWDVAGRTVYGDNAACRVRFVLE
jgi:hypothetical protein